MKNSTQKVVYTFAIIVNLLFIVDLCLCWASNFTQPYLAVLITLLMFAYHFDMRLLLALISHQFAKKINVNNRLYKVSESEQKVFKFFKVKNWKDKFAVWDKSLFKVSFNYADLTTLLKNNISAEITHHICFFVSFLSVIIGCLLSPSEWWIYLMTSIIASFMVDFPPILIQRYNRLRLQKLMKKFNHSL